MTSAETLATEAARLREVVGRQLPKIRRIVERNPAAARPAFEVIQGMVDAILYTIEAHREGFEACRDDPAHLDVEHALSAMTAELRWLADVLTPE
jgi:hypothetical protein